MRNQTVSQSGSSGSAQIELRGVSKSYSGPAGAFPALNAIDLEIAPGEFVAIVGKSGSGKSTLLHVLSGIDRPSSGEVLVQGRALQQMDEEQLAVWRGRAVGVVFQFFQLLPSLTVIENVMLPMDFCNSFAPRERHSRALSLLDQFGIADQANKLPAMLSGGQQQRAAMARAVANDPPIIVADEPTGNLDSQTAETVLQYFKRLSELGKTIVMVTHERDIARWAGRTLKLADGRFTDGNTQQEAAHAGSLE